MLIEYLIIIFFFIFSVRIISCDEFDIIRNAPVYSTHGSHTFSAVCITDSVDDAIIWNTDLNMSSSAILDDTINLEKSSKLSGDGRSNDGTRKCDINADTNKCNVLFLNEEPDWNLASSIEVPMGPVFDSRWEKFPEVNVFEWNVEHYHSMTINENGVNSNVIFGNSGAVVVSIRSAANAHVLICKDPDYHTSFCYWVIIGGWTNVRSAIRKCEGGVNGYPATGSPCERRRSELWHHPLSVYEWKTFVVTWNAATKMIKVYDPDNVILNYTDHDAIYRLDQEHYVFFGNPMVGLATQFRLHQYNYKLATRPGAYLISQLLNINVNGEVCISMLVGLCASCELHVSLVDSNDQPLVTEVFSGLAASKKVKHDLPMWQHARISVSNLDENYGSITLEIITKSRDERGNHWAISNVEQCLAEGTVKKVWTTVNLDNTNGIDTWPNVTCQKLSYNQEHESVIISTTPVTKPPGNETLCPDFRIGPKCATFCDTDFHPHCQSVTICNKNGCYCSQGHTSYYCNIPCSEPGAFGYNCEEKCENCQDNDCDIYTGSCTSQCKKLQEEHKYLVPPYCKDVVDSPEPQIDQVNETTLRIYFPKVDHDKKFNITYEFEIQVNRAKWPKQNAESGFDNDTRPIYFTTFNKLRLGMKYNARISQRIQYKSIDKVEVVSLDGDFSKQTTMCIWSEYFKIEPEDKNMTIKKIDNENIYPCPDDWYSVKVLRVTPNVNESETINITNTNGIFPMTVNNLTPATKYVVLITGMSLTFRHRQEVWTLVSKPSRVRKLKIDLVSSTEVSISWLPPKEPNGILHGYHLTIQLLRYEGCANSTSMNLIISNSYRLENDSLSYKISHLIPYVHYELTILAHHTRNGDQSSINFVTDATEIPTAVFGNITFNNNKISWSSQIDDCTTITGPISASRLFFSGVSQNVNDFIDEYDTPWHSFTLNRTKKQNIHGREQYRVRIHALRATNGIHNESAYIELTFITDPQPPPAVRNLMIIEVSYENRTTLLNWEKPLPPTNGEIEKYDVFFVGPYKTSDIITVFPNETCPLWGDSLCKTVSHPYQSRSTIQVRAVNKDVNEPGAVSEIADVYYETAPDPPGRVFTSKIDQGVVDLHWEHPRKTGGPMKKFKIQRELISTRLIKKLQDDDRNEIITFPIATYLNLYSTQLHLLPSSHYKINIQGVVETREFTLIGNPSSIEIDTTSSFSWYEDKPSYNVSSNNHLIILSIPSIANNTRNSEVHIVVIGKSLCENISILSESLARDIELEDDEVAWHLGVFTRPPSTILIGDHENDASNCPLHVGNSYVIAIIVREYDIKGTQQTIPFVWRSKPIQIGPIPRQQHEIWAVPLVLLIIAFIGITYYLTKKKKRIKEGENNIVVDVPRSVPTINEPCKKNHIKLPSPVCMKQRPGTTEYRESILLTPAVSSEKLNLTSINAVTYDKIKCTSLVKLNEFQDYVKHAIVSGKLDEQYSFFPRGQMKPCEYGQIPENKRKNRYGNMIAYDETRVILEKLPDDPYSDYINANYIKGYKRHRAYIATQGPKPTTVIDFWRMIWQERIQVICMLANVMESGKTKCEQYWPEVGKVMKYGNISVSNISHVQFADYTFRIFHVKYDQEIRKIEHLHYTAWPDHGIPLYTQSVVTYLKKLLATPSGIGPVVVHCSAGVGRTGTIILCDICLRRAAAEGVVDVFGETAEIRGQRANMVDNKQQYILAHVALVECLLSLPTAIPCNDSLPMRIQEYKNQLTLQQQRLEQSAWQDEALQSSMRTQLILSEKNITKNRFPDLLPTSRLFISRYPTTDDDSSYIFGVYVDSAKRQNDFIATQLPMPKTVTDFWRMVAEFKVQLIIILQPPELENPTCCKFLPEPDEELAPLTFLTLKGKSITNGEHCIQQKITLIDDSTTSLREQPITILTCKEWDPGRNKPPPTPEALVDLWQMAERISRTDESTVVVCHDGVTGCGLYLALSFLLERMSLEHECDVCLAIRAIRRSRSDFCQTREQFEYLYDAAVIYAGYFETYANFT